VKASIAKVQTGLGGFQRIVALESKLLTSPDGTCELSIDGWFDANMCAPLGAILHRHAAQGKTIVLSGQAPDIFRKNDFLSEFGIPSTKDTHGTTIGYRRFRLKDNESFQDYIVRHFKPKKRGLPLMTDALLRKFRESLFEVYGNAVDHSETQLGIFACGQYYPHNHRLDFSIADLGIGIRGRILKDLGTEMTSSQAIRWAMEGNTTRKGRPGGLGLKLIQEFIQLNGGRIIAVSGSGYWELSKKQSWKPRAEVLSCAFPGTVVTIEVNAADKKSYRLSSEVDPNRIF
jgi:signal transduction histidine kinase